MYDGPQSLCFEFDALEKLHLMRMHFYMIYIKMGLFGKSALDPQYWRYLYQIYTAPHELDKYDVLQRAGLYNKNCWFYKQNGGSALFRTGRYIFFKVDKPKKEIEWNC